MFTKVWILSKSVLLSPDGNMSHRLGRAERMAVRVDRILAPWFCPVLSLDTLVRSRSYILLMILSWTELPNMIVTLGGQSGWSPDLSKILLPPCQGC